MSEPSEGTMTTRVPAHVWEAALAVAGGSADVPAETLGELSAAGIASAQGELAPGWKSLLDSHRSAEVAFRFVSTFRGTAYLADVTVGAVNTSVLKRERVEPAPDGTLATVSSDGFVDISATSEHPWRLVREVLPPLGAFRADPAATPSDRVIPVTLAEDTANDALAALETEPGLTAAEALRRQAGVPESVRQLLAAEASVHYLVTIQPTVPGLAPGIGLGTYLAGEHLYRLAGKGGRPQWEQVEAGDLGYSFLWHLLGAQDAVAEAHRNRSTNSVSLTDGYSLFVPPGWVAFDLKRDLAEQIRAWSDGVVADLGTDVRRALRRPLETRMAEFLDGLKERNGSAVVLPGTPLTDRVSPLVAIRLLEVPPDTTPMDTLLAVAASDPSASLIDSDAFVGLRTTDVVDVVVDADTVLDLLPSDFVAPVRADPAKAKSIVGRLSDRKANHVRYLVGRPDVEDIWLDVTASVGYSAADAAAADEAVSLFDTLIKTVTWDAGEPAGSGERGSQ